MRSLHQDGKREGFTLAEVAVSALLTGMVLAGSMSLMGQAARQQLAIERRQRAAHYASDILKEAYAKPYRDPQSSGLALGRESGESAANRLSWDDCDDFSGMVESPLRLPDGTVIPGTTGWTRRVNAYYVHAEDLTQVIASDQGVKLLVASIEFNGTILFESLILRTDVDKQAP